MRAIITGSEGFIGSALAKTLRQRGTEVIGIDRKSGRLAEDIARYMPYDTDVVYHLAAQTSVFNEDSEQMRRDNIDSFMAVVDACAKHPNHPKLVYASSSTANPPNTTSLYGLTKYFNEVYARLYLPSATGARLHNVYGANPRQGTLLWCLLNKESVALYNGGKNVRHFTYIDDAVDGLIYASGVRKPLINIANPENATIVRFASLVKQYGGGVNIECIEGVRPLDRAEQVVNPKIPLAPLNYRTIEEGLEIAVTETLKVSQ